jgi:putative oxidoreductase
MRLELTVVGIRGARFANVYVVRELLAAGRIHMPVAARFPLEHADRAHQWFEHHRDQIGRIILEPWPSGTSEKERC